MVYELEQVLGYLDSHGGYLSTASAQMVLGDGAQMTLRAGGPGTGYWPSHPPYRAFEVLLDHKPGPVWRRFLAPDGLCRYVQVPWLLVQRHVQAHSDIVDALYETKVRNRSGLLMVQIAVDEVHQDSVRRALAALLGQGSGAQVVQTTFSLVE